MELRRQKWFCAQIGAREHYAVARALHKGRQLASLYTDFWAGSGVRWLAGGTNSRPLHSLAARYHPELADAAVRSWNWRALGWEAGLRNQWNGDRDCGPYNGFMEIGRRFGVRVREALKRRSDLGSDSIFFAYDTGALETMEWCRERGIRSIVNQMDPNRVEVHLVREEEKRWPGWQIQPVEVPEEYFRRREQEWALADRVLVNSEFCRESLVKQKVPAGKLVVIPLCYEIEGQRPEAGGRKSKLSTVNSQPSAMPLRVLWLGQVILRKGIQYLLAAARQLEKENIHFDIVGPIGIAPEAIASAPRNVTFHGRASRDRATEWYWQADVFVLPTLSDGFAITQLEAMAHGLPVVTTPCCGNVVSDGVDGFIVSPGDADALSKSLQRYLAEPGLLGDQRNAALAKVKQFNLDRLAANLYSLEQTW
jgi:glycosyltransferase involved in cell wall biosynthesis